MQIESKIFPLCGIVDINQERTFVLVKPDGVKRGLIHKVIGALENKGLNLVECKCCLPSEELSRSHYEEHSSKDFFEGLTKFLSSGNVVAMIWEGENCMQRVRDIIGSSNFKEALPGTIRGDFAKNTRENIVHASDSVANANREIRIWFK